MPLTLLYTYLSKKTALSQLLAAAGLSLFGLCASIESGLAQDWGYDNGKSNINKSSPLPIKQLTPGPKASNFVQAIDDKRSWMEIFALCASSNVDDDRKETLGLATLSTEQKDSLAKLLDTKLASVPSGYTGIGEFWRQTRPRILQELDVKESYRLLFRALIRHALSRKNTSLTKNAAESELLQTLLGASRIADPGPPALTEEAINAYADMTCFLFQKRKPDKSVDGDENRKIFADVIKDKFVRAPNPAAKAAMTNFDLTWACFRCRFMDVGVEEREKLSALMASSDGKSSAQLKQELVSPTMTKLFAMGPWGEKTN